MYKTFWFKYQITEITHGWVVSRKCWLWPIPTKFLNRVGDLQLMIEDNCLFSDEEVARIRLVKYLQSIGIY